MPANSSEGRRAAQASASPMDDDQVERDANLKKVQARDLVEFGMIPVSKSKTENVTCNVHPRVNYKAILHKNGLYKTYPLYKSPNMGLEKITFVILGD